MPTPRPIIVANIGETDGTSVIPAMMPMMESPMKIPNSAVPIGMPAAITEPKATSNTITATIKPMPSLP